MSAPVGEAPAARGADRGPEVRVARQAGACYGVERALRMVGESLDGARPVYTLGPLIHNPRVVSELEERGALVSRDVEGLPEGSAVVIRSHGVVPQVIERARERGLEVVDATCPHVKKAHDAAEELAAQGYRVVIVGEAGHPEVEGILAHAGEGAVVVADAAELEGLSLGPRVGVVVQTTQTTRLLSEVTAALAPRVRDLRVLNTVCAATTRRQACAEELAREADAMVVVGGRNSGNTTRLAEVCRRACADTHHVEGAEEIRDEWFSGARLVGVTAGASTPADQIEAVCARLMALPGAWRA